MGDSSTAEQADERLRALDPRFASAASNLTTRHTEDRGDKETALELARRAEEADPDDPHTSDTRG